MEFEGRDETDTLIPDVPVEDETTFSNPQGASGGLDPSIQQSINFHNNPEAQANSVLAAKGWPDFSNVRNQFSDSVDKRLIEAIVIKHASEYSSLPEFIKDVNGLIQKGETYDKFVSENFHTKEQIEQYIKSAAPS